MTWQKATQALVLVGLVVVIGYDVLAAVFGGYEATISYLTLGAATERPVVGAALGILIGHLLWPSEGVPSWRTALESAIVLAAAAGLWFLGQSVTIVAFMVGVPVGHLWWTQPAQSP